MARVGIDAGGTLIKVVYEEKGYLHYKYYPISKEKELLQWLQIFHSHAQFILTGGRAEALKQKMAEAKIVDEFSVICAGANYLLKEEGKQRSEYLLMNVGTGTSFFIHKNGKSERVLGTGLGGGTFIGLGKLLTGKSTFAQLADLAGDGSKEEIDVLVKDIYESSSSPIDGNLTASNFGKAIFVQGGASDKAAALTNMIAENLMLLAMLLIEKHSLSTIVFSGSGVSQHDYFQTRLAEFSNMFGYEAIFLERGKYSGAVGALLSANR